MASFLWLASRLVFLLINVAVIGEALRRSLKGLTGVLEVNDLIQALVLDTYLGGLVLYLLALPPGVFRKMVLMAITGASWALAGALVVRDRAYMALKGLPRLLRERGLEYALVIGLSTWNLWISLAPYTILGIGDLSDIWLHSLLITLILDNKALPRSLAPFGQAPVFYPLGFHTMAAYSVCLVGWDALLASIYVCVLFKAMAPLAGYALGRYVDQEGHTGLALAFVLGLISRWPRLIPYEAGPFVSGFPLFLLLMGLLARADRPRPYDMLLLGVLCGFLFVIYPLYTPTILVLLLSKPLSMRDEGNRPRELLLGCLYALLGLSIVASFNIVQFLRVGNLTTYSPTPGLKPDEELLLERTKQSLAGMALILDNLFWGTWLSLVDFTKTTILALVGASILAMPFVRAQGLVGPRIVRLIKYSFCGALVNAISILLSLHEIGLVPLGAVNFSYLFIMFFYTTFIPMGILFDLVLHIRGISGWKLSFSRHATPLGALMLLLILWPFIFYSAVKDRAYLVSHHMRTALLTQDEYEVIMWIKENLPEDAIILINFAEAGRVIPALAHRCVLPIGRGVYTVEFQTITLLVANWTFNPYFFDIVKEFHITHVFVGGPHFPGRPDWDGLGLWSNPNFKLLKKVGDAYVFEIVSYDPYKMFYDGFEGYGLVDRGWRITEMGLGDCEVIDGFYYAPGRRGLLIHVQKADQGSSCYTVILSKEVVVWRTKDLFLSFFLNMSDLDPGDGVRICIWSPDLSRRIAICNPGSWMEYQNCTFPILDHTGYYTINVSSLWLSCFNSDLPMRFFLTISCDDCDGTGLTVIFDELLIYSEGG